MEVYFDRSPLCLSKKKRANLVVKGKPSTKRLKKT